MFHVTSTAHSRILMMNSTATIMFLSLHGQIITFREEPEQREGAKHYVSNYSILEPFTEQSRAEQSEYHSTWEARAESL